MVEQEVITNLEKERQRLIAELAKLKVSIEDTEIRREGSPFGKREEEADEVAELEKKLIMQKHLSETLAEIERALEKYRAGTYGICDRCGKPIEPGRLEALPQANLCLSCKSKQLREARSR